MTAYRTNAIQRDNGPEFSFVEQMFMSSKLHYRFVGHSILVGKEIGRWSIVVGLIGGLFALAAGALWLISVAVEYVYHLLVNRHYSPTQALGIISISALLILVVFSVIRVLCDWVKENNKYMKERIAAKINKHQELSNGSEAS